ncbi:ribonuclease HI [Candidatus Cyanaurora vandensis]|uniref:ribonuclease HI n=1 Tax=Candidatus Cyanaurora vandensis TaxID=2714958 RepID=UPI002579582E|nr:ribonuclease HI [Candidatus Cyanaurora vandensis]
MEPLIRIYTDGACIGNPGPGGYAAIIDDPVTGERELTGGYAHTTNNRMEMLAVIRGLVDLPGARKVMVYSDSQYVINGITKGWAKKWKANNWIKADKKPALNPDLWQQLLDLCQQHQVTFEWVRGHSGHPQNERCDRLAVVASRRAGLPPDPQLARVGR